MRSSAQQCARIWYLVATSLLTALQTRIEAHFRRGDALFVAARTRLAIAPQQTQVRRPRWTPKLD